MADTPTSKVKIPTESIFTTLDGETMKEPTPDGSGIRIVTLGVVLGAAMVADVQDTNGLDVLDRWTLARRFRDEIDPEITVESLVTVKKIVTEAFKHAPLISGQALLLLGAEPRKDL